MYHDGLNDGELEARLRAHAAARLSPDPAWSARTRAALVALAEQHAPAQARLTNLEDRRRRRAAEAPHRARFRRRSVAIFLAATLAIAGVGTVLAADPGTPLYPARLWLETVTLPTATVDDVARLDNRIEDASRAATEGKDAGVSAAIEAYRASLRDAVKAASNDPERLRHLHHALGVNEIVLQALAESAKGEAAAAIKAALQESRDAAKDAGGKPAEHSPKP